MRKFTVTSNNHLLAEYATRSLRQNRHKTTRENQCV